MFAPSRRIAKRVGYRGASLATFGVLHLCYAVLLFTSPPGPRTVPLLNLLPGDTWGILWATTAAVGIWHAATHRRNGINPRVYACLTFPPAIWGIALILAPASRTWFAGIMFLALALLTIICAGWREPEWTADP